MRATRRTLVRSGVALALLATSGLLAAARVAADPDVEARGMLDPAGRYAALYDPGTVETVIGEVLRIDRIVEGVIPRRGVAEGVQLVVITHREILCVHVGPLWYVAAQPVAIAPGDRIEVRGSRVFADGRHLIVADRVRTETATLVLRRPDGAPVWNEWRMP